MYTQLLFLILALLLVNLGHAEEVPQETALYSFMVLVKSLWAFTGTLLLIFVQNRLCIRQKRGVSQRDHALFVLANIELLLFLGAHYFFFSGQQLSFLLPKEVQWSFFSKTYGLFLYFVGLGVFHWSHMKQTAIAKRMAWRRAWRKVRFIVPFVLPFLFIEFLLEVYAQAPSSWESFTWSDSTSWQGKAASLGLFLTFVGLLIVFMPVLVQWIWGCTEIPSGKLNQTLEQLCSRAGFRHAGMKVWTVMNHSVTAAIIGVVPRFRYVMFTKGLIQALSLDEVKAVLAHEIGHSQRYHLLLYPFVILGMVLLSFFFYEFVGEALYDTFHYLNLLQPNVLWNHLQLASYFIGFALFVFLYLRLVFGFFSRHFERQADLHCFALGVDPCHMVGALERIATLSHTDPKQKNWHHYSIAQRIDFLQKAMAFPQRIERHHRKVRRIVKTYFSLLVVGGLFFFLPVLPGAGTQKVMEQVSTVKANIAEWINGPLVQRLAAERIHRYYLPETVLMHSLLEESFYGYGGALYPGVAEFYAAQRCWQEQLWFPSVRLMRASWESFDFQQAEPSLLEELQLFTYKIVDSLDELSQRTPSLRRETQHLMETMHRVRRDSFAN